MKFVIKPKIKNLLLVLAFTIPMIALANDVSDTYGKPFWGWGDVVCNSKPCIGDQTQTWQTCYQSYYVFWIPVITETVSSGWVDCPY